MDSTIKNDDYGDWMRPTKRESWASLVSLIVRDEGMVPGHLIWLNIFAKNDVGNN